MTSELNTLHARLERLEQDNAQMKAQFHTAQRRLRVQAALAFVAFLAAVFLSPGNRAAIAQGYGVTLATLNTRLLAVEAKTQFQSSDAVAKSTTFSGCNVYIQSGSGSTSDGTADIFGQPLNNGKTLSGLGNLTIGYNASHPLVGRPDVRTGSHNLIVGDVNNYSSFGGVVVGLFNTISASYASVSGGQGNTASGPYASVSGGATNTASGGYASVSGGDNNTASGLFSSVSGGFGNTASGNFASVSGGVQNTVRGDGASVSGGFSLTQNNNDGWSGGTYHSP